MSSLGWIKLHRKIQDHWLYQEERTFSRYEAWLDMIMLANFEDKKTLIDGELVTIEQGSFITSKRKLSARWKWSNTKVNAFLNLLEQDEMITQKSDTKKTVITIGNYDFYHDKEKEKHHRNATENLGLCEKQEKQNQENARKNITENTVGNVDSAGIEENEHEEKHNGNIAETSQKHHRNTAKTHKQELKNLRTKEYISTTTNTRDGNSDAIIFYQENFGSITPHVSNDLLVWLDDLGDEMVIEAMKRSVERNKRSWGYVKSILQSWLTKNIKTVDQAKAEETEFRNQKQARFAKGNKAQRPEIVPDWFKNKDNQDNAKEQYEPTQKDLEAHAEMMKMLNDYTGE